MSIFEISNVLMKITTNEIVGSEKQDLLDKKVEYSNLTSNQYKIEVYSLVDYSKLNEKIYNGNQKSQEIEDKITNILNEYYPNEFASIQSRISGTEDLSIDRNFNDTSPETQLYNLILTILENKQLSEQDEKVLKDYMKEQYYNIKSIRE